MLRTVKALCKELVGVAEIAGNAPSLLRLAFDLVLYRVLRIGSFGLRNRRRTVRLRGGVILTYRLNRGDIQGIREVWLDKVYRLPFALELERVVDLGANIGLTTLYFAKVYGAKTLIAVEPNSENATLLRLNLKQNNVSATVVEAAIGPADGTAFFSDHVESNLGRVGAGGREVPMISMSTLRAQLPPRSVIDLVKIDIEGGEQALLAGPCEWLARVRGIIAEFHPEVVDYPGLVKRLEIAGFRWIRHGSVYKHTADAFIRIADIV